MFGVGSIMKDKHKGFPVYAENPLCFWDNDHRRTCAGLAGLGRYLWCGLGRGW